MVRVILAAAAYIDDEITDWYTSGLLTRARFGTMRIDSRTCLPGDAGSRKSTDLLSSRVCECVFFVCHSSNAAPFNLGRITIAGARLIASRRHHCVSAIRWLPAPDDHAWTHLVVSATSSSRADYYMD